MGFYVCYVAHVIPAVRHRATLYPDQNGYKIDITDGDIAAAVMSSMYGVGRTITEVKHMAVIIESIANNTGRAIQSVTAELVVARTVILQNRTALDYILAHALWLGNNVVRIFRMMKRTLLILLHIFIKR